jgi:hypothetical protein
MFQDINYEFNCLGLGKVIWYQQKVSTYVDGKSSAHLRGTWLKRHLWHYKTRSLIVLRNYNKRIHKRSLQVFFHL